MSNGATFEAIETALVSANDAFYALPVELRTPEVPAVAALDSLLDYLGECFAEFPIDVGDEIGDLRKMLSNYGSS